jgi:hypothetical protein
MREWRARKKGTPAGVMVDGVAGNGESEVKDEPVKQRRESEKKPRLKRGENHQRGQDAYVGAIKNGKTDLEAMAAANRASGDEERFG